MTKHLLIVLILLITLISAQPVSAATPTPTPKFYGIWQKMTLTNLLRQQAGITVTPTKTTASIPTKTPTPTPRATSTTQQLVKTPTPIKSGPTSAPAVVASAATNDVTAYIMKEINDYRASQGLGSVQTSKETCDFASIRAQEITSNFSHDGFTQRRDSKSLPYASWTAITENIAMTSNYKDVVTMWKNSSGHAQNMRANTPYVCVMQSGNYYAYEGMKP